ncbi:alpha/beta hydrolase [Caulobacter sp. 17J65-9]|uniref:alpha/beta fold hydrolase n=1 Tax=Caulobacter sp. 17J65-9 TaxID=2709382 RepID=UPI0013C9D4D0|nr:alpha/beta hydrolase [Caulobacter sp. 17J65-9]NEX94776.1 alpha/beta hydrolase [Caulobacter sp. 17J65-9]
MDAARFQEPRRRMIPIRSPWGDGEMAVLDFGDPGRPVDVVFLHANGFNALTYRSILAPLSASLRIVAPDLRGHGATRLPAEPRGRKSWDDYRDDLGALLDVLGGPPVTLAGHSMGGTVALLAAAKRPQRVSNLVMFDPVIWSPLQSALMHLPGAQTLGRARAPIALAAARRRAVFDSRADAFQAYKGRGAFKTWPDTVLADYVAGGFVERAEGGVELACSPEWETSNFVSQANRPWKALGALERPVRILRAPHSVTCHVGDAAAFRRKHPHATVETVEGSHFFPMERADLVRDAVLDAAV